MHAVSHPWSSKSRITCQIHFTHIKNNTNSIVLTIRLSGAAILQQPRNVKAYMCVYMWWMCRGASVCQAWRASCRPRTLGKRSRNAPDSGAEPTHSSHHTHGFSRAPTASELYNPTVRNPHAVSDVWLPTGKPLQNINRRIPENRTSCRREALRIHDRGGLRVSKPSKDGGLLIL